MNNLVENPLIFMYFAPDLSNHSVTTRKCCGLTHTKWDVDMSTTRVSQIGLQIRKNEYN